MEDTRFRFVLIRNVILRFAGLGLAFLIGVVFARLLEPELYGNYAIVLSLLTLFAIPIEVGLPKVILREVARSVANGNYKKAESIRVWALRNVTLVTMISFMFLSLYFYVYPEKTLGNPLLLGMGYILFVSYSNIYNSVLKGAQFIEEGQISDVICRPLLTLLLFFVFYFFLQKITLLHLMVIILLSALLSLFVSIYLHKKRLPAVEIDKKNKSYNYLYKSSIPMAMSESALLLRVHLLIIGAGLYVSASDAAILKVSVSSLVVFTFFLMIMNTVLSPVIAKSISLNNDSQVSVSIRRYNFVCIASTFISLVFFFLFGEYVFNIVYGQNYVNATTSFMIMGVGIFISTLFGPAPMVLNMSGLERFVTYSSIKSILLFLIVIYPFQSCWGVNGLSLSFSISLVYFNFITRKSLKNHKNIESSFLEVFDQDFFKKRQCK